MTVERKEVVVRNSLVKRLRREVNRKVAADMEDFISVLQQERLVWRLIIAFRIAFKMKSDVKFGQKRK